jgi:hypothetical protein
VRAVGARSMQAIRFGSYTPYPFSVGIVGMVGMGPAVGPFFVTTLRYSNTAKSPREGLEPSPQSLQSPQRLDCPGRARTCALPNKLSLAKDKVLVATQPVTKARGLKIATSILSNRLDRFEQSRAQ